MFTCLSDFSFSKNGFNLHVNQEKKRQKQKQKQIKNKQEIINKKAGFSLNRSQL